MKLLTAIFIVLFVTSCKSFILLKDKEELEKVAQSHMTEKIDFFYYMGSDKDFHYFFHSYTFGKDKYMIKRKEFEIEKEFPFTENSKKWRRIKFIFYNLPDEILIKIY